MSDQFRGNSAAERNYIMERHRPVFPYFRRKSCLDFQPYVTKFTWQEQVTSSSSTTRLDNDGKESGTERRTTTEIKDRSAKYMTYKQSTEEDVDSFFDCFDHMQTQLANNWNEASTLQLKMLLYCLVHLSRCYKELHAMSGEMSCWRIQQ